MIKRRLSLIALSMLLLSSKVPSYAEALPDENEQEESTEFSWDDENKGNALFVWEANEWEKYQDKLTLFGYVEPKAHADVNDKVRAMENKVRKVLCSDTTVGYGSFQKEHYTELVLAMIQVLAEQCGVLNIDNGDVEEVKNFDEWTITMGQYVSDTHFGGEWTVEESIRQIYYRYTLSAKAYATAHNSGKEPSLYEKSNGLKSAIEGTVLHFNNRQTGFFSYDYKVYTETAADSYYERNHKTEIDTYYSACTDKDYEPDSAFAKKVSEIYTVSSGYGDMAYTEDMNKYIDQAPNEKVKLLLQAMVSCAGGKYVYGGSNPKTGIDCSHLIWYALNHTPGISVIYVSSGSFAGSSYYQSISESSLQPGDIMWYEGHVAFYLGRNGNYYNTFEAWTENKPIGFNKKAKSMFKKFYRCKQLYQ